MATLREQFKNIDEDNKTNSEIIGLYVDIVDLYVLSFAKWILSNKDRLKKDFISNEELIEKFKKEKGL